MLTAHSLDSLLHQIAMQQPNEAPVLSAYVNSDREGRQYFEQRVCQLRNSIASAQRGAFDETVRAARLGLKQKSVDSTANVLFARGGQRMFFYQATLAHRVVNRVTNSRIPSLYGLAELRDNFDRFCLLHILPDFVQLNHFELGALQKQMSFRARFGSDLWRQTLIECTRQFASQNSAMASIHWIVAAPADLIVDCQSFLRCPLDALVIDSLADAKTVHQIAVQHFREREELKSRHFSDSLVRRSKHDNDISVGPQSVLEALALEPIKALALQARTSKDLALRWIRKEPDLFTVHDEVVWLAKRSRTHVEIVDDSPALSQVGGIACLRCKK